MIVKVQISQFNSEGLKMMLVYDKERKYELEMEAPDLMIKWMNGAQKKFFNVKLVPDDRKGYENNDLIDFGDGEEAAWQSW